MMNITYRVVENWSIVEDGYSLEPNKPPTDNLLKMVSEISKC